MHFVHSASTYAWKCQHIELINAALLSGKPRGRRGPTGYSLGAIACRANSYVIPIPILVTRIRISASIYLGAHTHYTKRFIINSYKQRNQNAGDSRLKPAQRHLKLTA